MNLYRLYARVYLLRFKKWMLPNKTYVWRYPKIKENAIELLRKHLASKTKQVYDRYRFWPARTCLLEEKIGMTRKAIETVYRYGFGFTVITEIAVDIARPRTFTGGKQKAKCVVQMTLTTYNDSLCKMPWTECCRYERKVCRTKKLRDAGIPTVVWLTPILPFINDTIENIEGIFTVLHRGQKCSVSSVSAWA